MKKREGGGDGGCQTSRDMEECSIRLRLCPVCSPMQCVGRKQTNKQTEKHLGNQDNWWSTPGCSEADQTLPSPDPDDSSVLFANAILALSCHFLHGASKPASLSTASRWSKCDTVSRLTKNTLVARGRFKLAWNLDINDSQIHFELAWKDNISCLLISSFKEQKQIKKKSKMQFVKEFPDLQYNAPSKSAEAGFTRSSRSWWIGARALLPGSSCA